MPWLPEDAYRHDHKADTPHLQRLWAEVADSVLVDTGDEGRAVRIANAAVAKARRGGEENQSPDRREEPGPFGRP